jgi:hypothetical protein
MRLLLVCAALCVGWPAQTSRDLVKSQESHPQATTASIEPIESARSEDFALRFVFEIHAMEQVGLSEQALTPDMFAPATAALATFAPVAAAPMTAATDVTEPEPTRVFSRKELCSTAALVAEANNLPVPFFANLSQQ